MRRFLLVLVVILSLVLGALYISDWFKLALQLITFGFLLLVFLAFVVTLLPKRTPMISCYALLLDKDLSPDEMSYTRKVTWVWVGVFSLIISLKLFGYLFEMNFSIPVEIWSFLLIAGLFILEFYIRKLIFPHKNHGSLIKFIRAISHLSLIEMWSFSSQNRYKS